MDFGWPGRVDDFGIVGKIIEKEFLSDCANNIYFF